MTLIWPNLIQILVTYSAKVFEDYKVFYSLTLLTQILTVLVSQHSQTIPTTKITLKTQLKQWYALLKKECTQGLELCLPPGSAITNMISGRHSTFPGLLSFCKGKQITEGPSSPSRAKLSNVTFLNLPTKFSQIISTYK